MNVLYRNAAQNEKLLEKATLMEADGNEYIQRLGSLPLSYSKISLSASNSSAELNEHTGNKLYNLTKLKPTEELKDQKGTKKKSQY